ncbi:hypothetical protein DEU56DRAFT_825542 [Suillus clintonianus]|uniref:uncharacterized protein n=1 Tax=Suillus clintonianus TaxID=1904413 RepID=UPI001B86EEA3|nr:uncharacterized protein DEU56DRAFT_825542 [Suillus clintonianus]KAG2125414.1 hypothetical protein DEU56DRAFT_825542 [Suillus clintonianus]
MSDPVSSKSAFLCMYMKNHPDTLVAYVKYFGKVEGNVLTAEMSSIDSKGMTLVYKLKSGQSNTIRVSFDPPLSGYEEVKPRLLSMKAEAQEGLGMLKAPQLTTFRLPGATAIAGAVLTLSVYFYFISPPSLGTTVLSIPVSTMDTFFSPAHAFRNATGLGLSFRTAGAIIGAIHAVESLYTWSLCRQYVKGTVATAAYIGGTMMVGAPVWSDIKRRVQEKRIESVMKVE